LCGNGGTASFARHIIIVITTIDFRLLTKKGVQNSKDKAHATEHRRNNVILICDIYASILQSVGRMGAVQKRVWWGIVVWVWLIVKTRN
jgi:N-acyl-L-homoserine lactone synthetase